MDSFSQKLLSKYFTKKFQEAKRRSGSELEVALRMMKEVISDIEGHRGVQK